MNFSTYVLNKKTFELKNIMWRHFRTAFLSLNIHYFKNCLMHNSNSSNNNTRYTNWVGTVQSCVKRVKGLWGGGRGGGLDVRMKKTDAAMDRKLTTNGEKDTLFRCVCVNRSADTTVFWNFFTVWSKTHTKKDLRVNIECCSLALLHALSLSFVHTRTFWHSPHNVHGSESHQGFKYHSKKWVQSKTKKNLSTFAIKREKLQKY